jgi:hypothetical protein
MAYRLFIVGADSRFHDAARAGEECQLELPGSFLALKSLDQLVDTLRHITLRPCLACTLREDMEVFWDAWAAGRRG